MCITTTSLISPSMAYLATDQTQQQDQTQTQLYYHYYYQYQYQYQTQMFVFGSPMSISTFYYFNPYPSPTTTAQPWWTPDEADKPISVNNTMPQPLFDGNVKPPSSKDGNVKPPSSKVSSGSKNLIAFISRGPRLSASRRRSTVKQVIKTPVDQKKLVPKENCVTNAVREEQSNEKTCLMIKNIPNIYKRECMMELLDLHCILENEKAASDSDPIRSEYDFFYLPMDFVSNSNLGYAFVNFTNPDGALRLCSYLQGFEWFNGNGKIAEITWARLQGKEEMKAHFMYMKFRCSTDGYLPVVFTPPRDGLGVARPEVIGYRIKPAKGGCRKMLKDRRLKRDERVV